MLDADDGGQSFTCIITGEVWIGILEQTAAPGIIINHTRDGSSQSGQVRATIDGVDGVGKGIYRFRIGIGELNGSFDAHPFDIALGIHNRMEFLAVAVQIPDKGSDAAFKIEGHLGPTAFIRSINGHAAGDKCHFPENAG